MVHNAGKPASYWLSLVSWAACWVYFELLALIRLTMRPIVHLLFSACLTATLTEFPATLDQWRRGTLVSTRTRKMFSLNRRNGSVWYKFDSC